MQNRENVWGSKGVKGLKTILGIGTAGCNVVEQLSEYSAYECYYISNEIEKTSKYKFALQPAPGPEQYEKLDMTKLHKWLEKINQN